MLHKIWVISRNLVNIIFVFLLLYMALKEIFFVGKETDLKKNLIKFTFLLIFVNFSWLTTKVVLDAAQVVTHIVFAIPSGISGDTKLPQCVVDTMGKQPLKGACSPTTILAPADSGSGKILYFEDDDGDADDCDKVKKAYDDAYDSKTGEAKEPKDPKNKAFHKRTSMCMENLNFFKYDQNTAVIYLTYGMARIQNLVNSTAGDDAIQLAVGVVMSLVMQAAYAIALTALFVALIVRMLMLWMFVGFSPILVLILYFKGEDSNPLAQLEGKFDFQTFAKWAFVPAKVGAVFVVSFIMISAGQSLGDVLVDNVTNQSGMTFKILEGKSIFMGLGSMQTFIWLLMSIAVLWLGVFAVLSDMPVIGTMASNILSATKQKAATIAKSPLYAPILPLKGGKKTSIAATFKKFDFTEKLRRRETEGLAGTGDIARLSSHAKNLSADDVHKVDTGNMGHLNKLAVQLGAKDAQHLVDTYTDKDIAAALKSGKVKDQNRVDKVASAFSNLRLPKTAGGGSGGGGGGLTQDQAKEAHKSALREDRQSHKDKPAAKLAPDVKPAASVVKPAPEKPAGTP